MAGVYIKGVYKPKECRDCPFNIVGLCTAKVAVFGKEPLNDPGEFWCPLVEVPEHGDLIDRDALEDTVMRLNFPEEYPPDDDEEVMESRNITRGEYKLIDNVLFQMPVVIPADRSER